MIYLVEKKTDIVKMVSEDLIEYDPNIFYIEDIDDSDYQGYSIKIVDGKLIKEKITP